MQERQNGPNLEGEECLARVPRAAILSEEGSESVLAGEFDVIVD